MAQPPRTLANLRPNPKNPRTITAAKRKQLAAALDKFGDLGGIVFNARSGQLVGGHQRVSAFNAQTPVVVTKAYDAPTRTGTVAEGYVVLSGERFSFREVQWDDATEKAANLAANKGAGEFDLDQVSEWFEDLKENNFDLNLTMFDEDEQNNLPKLDQITDSPSNADISEEVTEPPAVPATKLGDCYQLGRHLLRCGNSSDPVTIDLLIGSHKVQMVYSDPPYGMRLDTGYAKLNVVKARLQKSGKYNYAVKSDVKSINHRPVHGDDSDYDPGLILDKFAGCDEIFLWGADYYCQHLPKEGSWIVWDKRSKSDGDPMGEFHGAHFELCWSKSKHQRKICRHLWMGAYRGSREVTVHPTQKPVAVALWFLGQWGKPNDVVVDLYGGSGSTLLACERADRTCLMMEIDPGYCDVIIQRWEAMTGKKAQLVGNRTAKDALHA